MSPEDVKLIADAVVEGIAARERAQERGASKVSARLLTYSQAGEALGGMSPGAVRKMVCRGQLRGVRRGRRRFIDSRDLETYIDGERFRRNP